MSIAKGGLGLLSSVCIGLKGFLCSLLFLGVHCKFCLVTEVVRFHLVEKYLRFVWLRIRNQVFLKQVENILAYLSKLNLNLVFVVLDFLHIFRVSLIVFLLLNRGEHSPSSSSCSDNIFECHRQNVSLFNCQFLAWRLCELLGIVNHLCRCKLNESTYHRIFHTVQPT